ncbi:MAG: guanylate kinase [Gammaproteobacteria bacterium]|nr:MAG: guanylate kinase [Gammaproteobacteria bacterium]
MANLFIITAPSGVGKTSLIRELMQQDVLSINLAISHTTRPARDGERDGVEYYFIDELSFKKMINDNDFVEYAEVFNNFYGTSKQEIANKLSENQNIILEIDWQGAKIARKVFKDAISIFILPPSIGTIEKRLNIRATDNLDIIKNRLKQSKIELSHYDEADYLIINDDFQQAVQDLHNIIVASHNNIKTMQKQYSELIESLLK